MRPISSIRPNNYRKKNVEKLEMLRNDNFYDENSEEFNILGNSAKLFKHENIDNVSRKEISGFYK